VKSKLIDAQAAQSSEQDAKTWGQVEDQDDKDQEDVRPPRGNVAGNLAANVSRMRRGDASTDDFPIEPAAFLDADVAEKPVTRSPTRKRLISLAGAAIVVAIMFFVIPRLWSYFNSYETTDDAEIDGHVNPISSRIDGTVVKVYVHENQEVEAGAPLVDIDPRDQQVAVEQAQADYAQAQAVAATSRRDHEASLARVRADQATNIKGQADAARYRALYAQNIVSREEYDQSIAAARVDAAQVDVDSANAGSAERTIASRDAGVASAKAKLDQAELNLSYTTITAPVAGIIGKKTVEVGQRVQSGEELLAVIPLDDIWVTADFKETQLRRMHQGQQVTIYVDAFGRDYRGYVEALAGASGEKFSLLPPENATGNYVKVVQRFPVRIRLYPGQNQDHLLRPGMSVEPTVWLQ